MLRPEINPEPMTAGAVGAVLVPGRPNSAGAQFFICASDQAALQGQFTVFGARGGRARRGPADLGGRCRRTGPAGRSHRDQGRDDPRHAAAGQGSAGRGDRRRPRGVPRGARDDRKARSSWKFLADKAPETARQFLRLSAAGVYDGTAVPSRRAELRAADRRAGVSRQAADDVAERAGPQSPARILGRAERARHRVDGARRRPGQRDHLLLHLHRRMPRARRQIHRLRARRSAAWTSSRRSPRRLSTARRRGRRSS